MSFWLSFALQIASFAGQLDLRRVCELKAWPWDAYCHVAHFWRKTCGGSAALLTDLSAQAPQVANQPGVGNDEAGFRELPKLFSCLAARQGSRLLGLLPECTN